MNENNQLTPLEKARKKYDDKRIKKTVSFRTDDELEKKILEYTNEIDFSAWVKQKLLAEMQENSK